MPIIRAEHRQNYYVAANTTVNDSSLSYKARGILAYLLSKPDDWKVLQEDIAKHSIDGLAAVRAGIKELIKAGYIRRRQIRDEKNRIKEWEYIVFECPGSPQCDFQQVENHMLLSTEVTKYEINQIRNNDNGTKQSFAHVDTLRFYNWYINECYPHYKKKPHPRLKKAQKETVLSSLDGFIIENDLDISGLGDMANKYFQGVKNCDHNINHFATEGIMMNRFYEACY